MARKYPFPNLSDADAASLRERLLGLGGGVEVTLVREQSGTITLVATYPDVPGAPPSPVAIPIAVPGSPPVLRPPERRSAPIPANDPTPVAPLPVDGSRTYWPVVSSDPQALVVSFHDADGTPVGRSGRCFFADRQNGARHHVGVDLFADEGDDVVAVTDGKIASFYPFYAASNGRNTFALFVSHGTFVANYGEVAPSSLTSCGLRIGDYVTAGQVIGRVGATGMLHFETYRPGTLQNVRWMAGGPRPAALLDPSDLLLQLASDEIARRPSGRPPVRQPAAVGVGTTYAGPRPGAGDWHQEGGQTWRWDVTGVQTLDQDGKIVQWRTDGTPGTCREIWRLFAPIILAAASKHGVNPALIMMTIATETGNAEHLSV